MISQIQSLPYRLLRIFISILLLTLAVAPTVQAQTANVTITIPPGERTPDDLAAQIAGWRQSGQVSNVLWLDSTQKDKAGFSTLITLEFPNQGSCDAWTKEIAPKLSAPLVVHQADVLYHSELSPRDSNKSIFSVNIYEPIVPPAQYKDYVDDYIVPLMDGQRAAKVLISYTMYLERDPAGKAHAVSVMEYRNSVAFETATKLKKELRTQLAAKKPAYAKAEATKDTIRKDLTITQAAYQELPPPQLPDLPPYKVEYKVVGGLRIMGSELKNAVVQLAEGFSKFHPDARVATSYMTSSEGGIAGLYFNLSDVAPMGDDAKITDVMPFYNAMGYMPTEISVATGGYEKRGSLFAWAIVVNKNNPLEEISVDQLERIFGAERTGGWELINDNYMYTSKYARTKDKNIRRWGQLGLTGEFADKEIGTFGYCAPGFAIYFERNWFHWSKKWNPNFEEYVEPKQVTPDAAGQAVSADRPLEALLKDKYSIGIAALMNVRRFPELKVLKISPRNGGAAVLLTPDNVANRAYPLIRDAYFYVNKPPGRSLDPRAREFMRFVLSREGQEIIARMGYYYPLKADYLKEQLKKLD